MTDLDFMVLDGETLSEFLAVPVIVAAWILVVVFLDPLGQDGHRP
jgi:hypothetical protein